ncbi:MAG: SDR family oxidoreductase [Albidovulum sp.]|uniref:SDR family NAD(P)-dependent oxidoreductase n=1 Tax=Albidovulum sp. TaxID=1872424 RepID=UPI003C91831A
MSEPRIALVTGAASGIGLAVADWLAHEGCRVVLADLRSAKDACAAINQRHGQNRSAPFTADISNPDEVEALFAMVARDFGRLDILVNNAGAVRRGALDALSLDDIDLMLNVNLRGTILCSRAALPLLRSAPRAAIVNIASELALVGAPDLQVYCATKGGIVQLTRAMAVDHAPEGIRVNCVCPGPVLTPFIQARIDADPDPAAKRQEYASSTLLGRIGLPEEIAAVVGFVASDEAAFMTGAILAVDGGATAM